MGAPMIDDIELKAVQHIRQDIEQDFSKQRIAGLEGTLHQKLGRRSHRIVLTGLLLPETAAEDLEKLQTKAAAGEEVTFTADITTALSVEKMVIESFSAEQQVGPAGQTAYHLVITESPPLPPPAEVSAFGGLGDFGLGDLGFDPGALGDVLESIEEQAGSVMDAVDSAIDAVEQIAALASLADLANIGNPIKPITDKLGELSSLAPAVAGLGTAVEGLTG
jgi:phage protein U